MRTQVPQQVHPVMLDTHCDTFVKVILPVNGELSITVFPGVNFEIKENHTFVVFMHNSIDAIVCIATMLFYSLIPYSQVSRGLILLYFRCIILQYS